MFYLKNIIAIFTCVFRIIITFVIAEDICGQTYEVPKWELFDPEPAFIRLGLVPLNKSGGIPALEIQIENIKQNFSVTLLANPFVKNKKNCLPVDSVSSSYRNLRKFHRSYYINVNNKESIYFGDVFTGCYYVQMTNETGQKWLLEPRFFNTSHPYYDTMLNCKKVQFAPKNYDSSRQLNIDLNIPLTCFSVQCMLFERNDCDGNTKTDLDNGIIRPTRNCSLIYRGNGVVPLVECWRNDTSPILHAEKAFDYDEGWNTSIKWDGLKESGAFYYTSFINYDHSCKMNRRDLKVWVPVIKFGALVHGFINESNIVSEFSDQPDFLQSTIATALYILLGVSITAILVYWILKYAKMILHTKHRRDNSLVSSPKIPPLINQKEFNQILMIYAKDSSTFMAAMDSFRKRLHQTCGLPVHDLFLIDDWNTIAKLGAVGWVEELLRSGCKVVWVDTPKFRSVLKESKLNEQEKKQILSDDFRDDAVPYAVTLAKDLFQNVTTQYRCHFVIRLQGFPVQDEDDDPLLAVSPHARYSIPEHYSLLCEQLAR